MANINTLVAQIRQALFGKDVRESIAQGIETCYNDLVVHSKDLVIIQNTQPNPIPSFNEIWIEKTGTEYTVPTMDDVATVAETKTYLGIS